MSNRYLSHYIPEAAAAAGANVQTSEIRLVVAAAGTKPRRVRSIVTFLRGAAKISATDPLTRPALIVRGPTPTARFARRPPRLSFGAKDAPVAPVGRSSPARVLLAIQPRHHGGIVTILRGASRIGLADPRTKPAIIVRGYVPPRRLARLQPDILAGASRIGIADSRTWPVRPVIGVRRPYRGTVIATKGAARVGLAAPMTRPVMIATAKPNLARSRWRPKPWQPANRKEPGLVTDRPPKAITQVTVSAKRRPIRQPWLGKSVKDIAVVATDRSRPALLVSSPRRRRAVIQPQLGKPARLGATDARLTGKAILTLPSSRPRRAPIQPWTPESAKVGDRSVHPILMARAPKRRRLTLQPYQPHGVKTAVVNQRLMRSLMIAAPGRRRHAGSVWMGDRSWIKLAAMLSAMSGTLIISSTLGRLAFSASDGSLMMSTTGGTIALSRTDGTLTIDAPSGALTMLGGSSWSST